MGDRGRSNWPLRALPPPLDRNDRSPLRSASAAPKPALEVENLGLGVQTGPEQRVRRQQRDVVAGGAIDLQRPSTHQPFANPPATFQKRIKMRHAVTL